MPGYGLGSYGLGDYGVGEDTGDVVTTPGRMTAVDRQAPATMPVTRTSAAMTPAQRPAATMSGG